MKYISRITRNFKNKFLRSKKCVCEKPLSSNEEVDLKELFSICRSHEEFDYLNVEKVFEGSPYFIKDIMNVSDEIEEISNERNRLNLILNSEEELSIPEVFRAERFRQSIAERREGLEKLFLTSRNESLSITKCLNSIEFQIRRNEDEIERLEHINKKGVIKVDDYLARLSKSRFAVRELKNIKHRVKHGLDDLNRTFRC